MLRVQPVGMAKVKNDKWNTTKKNRKLDELPSKSVNTDRQDLLSESEDELTINT